MTRQRWSIAGAALVVVALVAALAAVLAADDDGDSAIAWGPCTFGDDPAFADEEDPEVREASIAGLEDVFADTECATVEVPVDYENPEGATLEIFVARRPAVAPDSLGPLFVNQGGPGVEGVRYSAGFIADPTFDRFDVIGMDPRGTGRSTRVDCGAGSAAALDEMAEAEEADELVVPSAADPTTALESAAQDFANACATDPNLAFFGSNNAARDMDRVRELLGADQITYHGKSYGSDLGTAYVGLFPERVRAAVFDGASDLTLDPVDFVAQQAVAGEQRLERYLEHCRSAGCAWAGGADPADAWTALVDRLRAEPIVDADTGAVVSSASLLDWARDAVTSDADMEVELDGLVLEGDTEPFAGDDTDLADLALGFFGVTCLDLPVESFREAASRLGAQVDDPPADLLETLAVCSEWPASDPVTVTDAGESGPILVTATTGDVPTPYVSSVGLAEALEPAVLVEYEGQSHTAYLVSPCVKAIVDEFLVDLELPPSGTRCEDAPDYDDLEDAGDPEVLDLP